MPTRGQTSQRTTAASRATGYALVTEWSGSRRALIEILRALPDYSEQHCIVGASSAKWVGKRRRSRANSVVKVIYSSSRGGVVLAKGADRLETDLAARAIRRALAAGKPSRHKASERKVDAKRPATRQRSFTSRAASMKSVNFASLPSGLETLTSSLGNAAALRQPSAPASKLGSTPARNASFTSAASFSSTPSRRTLAWDQSPTSVDPLKATLRRSLDTSCIHSALSSTGTCDISRLVTRARVERKRTKSLRRGLQQFARVYGAARGALRLCSILQRQEKVLSDAVCISAPRLERLRGSQPHGVAAERLSASVAALADATRRLRRDARTLVSGLVISAQEELAEARAGATDTRTSIADLKSDAVARGVNSTCQVPRVELADNIGILCGAPLTDASDGAAEALSAMAKAVGETDKFLQRLGRAAAAIEQRASGCLAHCQSGRT